MSEAPYKSSLIEALRGAGMDGATMGGNVQFLNFPWMQNTDVALRQRPAKSYLASPELLEYADLPYIPPAPKGGGMSAVPPGVPNPNTIGETIPEKKAEPETVTEAQPAPAPKGEPIELREQEKTGVITVEELPPADEGELADLEKKGVITVEELPPEEAPLAGMQPELEKEEKTGVVTVEELSPSETTTAGTQPELEKEEKTGVVTVEELAEQPAAAPTAREVLEELIPEEEKPEPKATVTVEEIPQDLTVRQALEELVPQKPEEPEVSVTVEELPPPPPPPPPPVVAPPVAAPVVEPKSELEPEASVTVEELPQEEPAPQAEPTLEEVIDYINALTQAAATEPEAEPEPETSVTVEELPAEAEPAPDGRGGSMPFVTSLAREMALLAAMGDMLGTANDPKGEITIEELFGE